MGDTFNVFISWSGERSKQAAEALREWLGTLLQNARPWMSDTDIEKGSRGLDEVARALEGMKIGIICLTPENLNAEWILYEAGALSKTLDAKTRVCTYLLAGLESRNLKPPLGLFQWTRADKAETRKLIHTINKHLDVTPVPENRLDNLFDKMWPELEAKLEALPAPPGALPPPRSSSEMIAEILELTRAMAPEIQAISRESATTRAARHLVNAYQKARVGQPARGSIFSPPIPPPPDDGILGSIIPDLDLPSFPDPYAQLADLPTLPSANTPDAPRVEPARGKLGDQGPKPAEDKRKS